MSSSIRNEPRWVSALLHVGPVLLLVACTIYGITEVHSSTDTYIGLAGGRAILESPDGFPVADTFSYTFHGRPWINQNWLTHVWHYWLYDTFGPDAVIWGTWLMSASIVGFAMLAVWVRTESLLGALLAASVVAFGIRDFVSARPATTGFFAIAVMWFLVCAMEGRWGRGRVWPLVGVLALMLAWGAAHGSFVFGYVIFGLYAAYIGLLHGWRRVFGPSGRPPLWVDALVIVITLAGCLFVALWITPGNVLDETYLRFVQREAPALLAKGQALAVLGGVLLAGALFAAFVRDRRREPTAPPRQAGGVVAALLAAFLLTLAFGPFGWENFVHGEKVGASQVWRSVSEWHPPYLVPPMFSAVFPPVARIWAILTVAALAAVLLGGIAAALWLKGASDRAGEQRPGGIHISAFDVLALGIGLILMFFARRFSPVFLIFAAPLATLLAVQATRRLPGGVRAWTRYALVGLAWIALAFPKIVPDDAPRDAQGNPRDFAAGAGYLAWWATVEHIARGPFAGSDLGLLERVTRLDATPRSQVEYLSRNDLRANVFSEWTQAGVLMFYAPNVRVYMDGRAQQVYDVEHYLRYREMTRTPALHKLTPAQRADASALVLAELDRSKTDMVLLRTPDAVLQIIAQSGDWTPVLLSNRSELYARRGSPVLDQVRARLEAGDEWRPDSPLALAARGFVWLATEPQDPARALQDWTQALQQQLLVGRVCYQAIVRTLLDQGRSEEAVQLVAAETRRVRSARGAEELRRMLLSELRSAQRMIENRARQRD